MRRPLALLALAVMTWSNAAALQCPASTLGAPGYAHPAASHALAAEEHAGHDSSAAHTGHGSGAAHPAQDDAPGHEQHGRPSHPTEQDCGIMMACGTAIGAPAAEADPTLPESFDVLRASPLPTPSTADLSRDTPPPRRIA